MTIIEKVPIDELKRIASECTSMREFSSRIGYKSTCCFDVIRKKCLELDISIEHFTGLPKDKIKRNEENTFIENSSAGQAVLRKLYFKGQYTEYKCSICGLEPFWNGKDLTLTLDHINGINHDDRLENLRWVCPNCDRQLDTFGSKNYNKKNSYNHKEQEDNYCIDCNKKIGKYAIRCIECNGIYNRKVERPSKEELNKLLFENNGNFSKIAKMFNVTDNTVRKWCKKCELPYHSTDYKNS